MSSITNWPLLLPVWIHVYIKINAYIYINATAHPHFKLNFCYYCNPPAVPSQPTRGATTSLRFSAPVDTFKKPSKKNEAASVSHLHWRWFLASASWHSWFITICLTERLQRLIRRSATCCSSVSFIFNHDSCSLQLFVDSCHVQHIYEL